jgi:hypothetical protein
MKQAQRLIEFFLTTEALRALRNTKNVNTDKFENLKGAALEPLNF